MNFKEALADAAKRGLTETAEVLTLNEYVDRVAERPTIAASAHQRVYDMIRAAGFSERHARALEDWQRDVISIVRSEQSYFVPQLRTKLLNEDAAVLAHQEICQRLFLPADQYWEYEQLNASVVRPHPGSINPDNLGTGLHPEYARGTLTQVALLWGKPCTVATVKGRESEEAIWFTGHPDGRSEEHAEAPR